MPVPVGDSAAVVPAFAEGDRGAAAVVSAWVVQQGHFVPALEEFFGTSAGLSASVVTRLTTAWQQEYRAFAERDLSGVDYVYVWVDGIHFRVRLDQDRVCTLVIIGARADGKKELVALSDGHRESTPVLG
jgi:putative transposase